MKLEPTEELAVEVSRALWARRNPGETLETWDNSAEHWRWVVSVIYPLIAHQVLEAAAKHLEHTGETWSSNDEARSRIEGALRSAADRLRGMKP